MDAGTWNQESRTRKRVPSKPFPSKRKRSGGSGGLPPPGYQSGKKKGGEAPRSPRLRAKRAGGFLTLLLARELSNEVGGALVQGNKVPYYIAAPIFGNRHLFLVTPAPIFGNAIAWSNILPPRNRPISSSVPSGFYGTRRRSWHSLSVPSISYSTATNRFPGLPGTLPSTSLKVYFPLHSPCPCRAGNNLP